MTAGGCASFSLISAATGVESADRLAFGALAPFRTTIFMAFLALYVKQADEKVGYSRLSNRSR